MLLCLMLSTFLCSNLSDTGGEADIGNEGGKHILCLQLANKHGICIVIILWIITVHKLDFAYDLLIVMAESCL